MNTTKVKLLSALSFSALGFNSHAEEDPRVIGNTVDFSSAALNTQVILDNDVGDYVALATSKDAVFNGISFSFGASFPNDIAVTAEDHAYGSLTGFLIQTPSSVSAPIGLNSFSIVLRGRENDLNAGSISGLVIENTSTQKLLGTNTGVAIKIYDQSTNHVEGATLTGYVDKSYSTGRITSSNVFINASEFDKYNADFVFESVESEMMEAHKKELQAMGEAQAAGAETLPYLHKSAETIVGMELGSVSENLSGSTVSILADSSDTGTVTGFKLTGEGSSRVGLDANGKSHVTYDQKILIINTGGTTTGTRVTDTHARQIKTDTTIRGVNTIGMHVSSSTIEEINVGIQIRDDSNNAVGLLMDPYTNGQKNVTDLKTTIKIFNGYEGQDNNSALLRLETDDFVEFSGENHFVGVNTGLGMDIQLRKEDSQSGLINGKIEVTTVGDGSATLITGGTYLPDGTTLGNYELRDLSVDRVITMEKPDGELTSVTLTQEWVMLNEPTGNYNKTNIGIKVDAIDADYKKATLNFGADAVIKTYIGKGDDITEGVSSAYGDVINYETDTLVLNSQATGQLVPNSEPLEGAQNQPDLPSSAKFRGDISYSGKDITKTHLNLRSGNFEFESDYWYATKISFGDGKHVAGTNKGTVSQVKHLDSTALKASELAFHVNDVDEHSILIIDDGHTVDLSTVKHVDITLADNYTDAAAQEIVLIDGMIKDAGTGYITFNIDFVGADGLNSGYTPEDFHIKYRGVSYAYNETVGGFAIQLGEASGDDLVLVIGSRGDQIIPEPSSVSLSLAALTALLMRRRRRRSRRC